MAKDNPLVKLVLEGPKLPDYTAFIQEIERNNNLGDSKINDHVALIISNIHKLMGNEYYTWTKGTKISKGCPYPQVQEISYLSRNSKNKDFDITLSGELTFPKILQNFPEYLFNEIINSDVVAYVRFDENVNLNYNHGGTMPILETEKRGKDYEIPATISLIDEGNVKKLKLKSPDF